GELDHIDYFRLIQKTSELGIRISFGCYLPWPLSELNRGVEPFWKHLDKIGYKQVGKNQWTKEAPSIPYSAAAL
ncbi:MAG TPA: hypothetical protein VGQ59_11830, partial [Cyclobacteriaceae bacterium]|nr:hypothetical protein [Cyclobacteriaceae bacterium]